MSIYMPRISYTRRPVSHVAALALAETELSLACERRSIRDFSDAPVPYELVETAVRIACTAPSGANQQPYRFVIVSDPRIKRQIRVGAEAEEEEFYTHRAPQEWLDALAPLGTDTHKPFLETAPYLIVVFREVHGVTEEGNITKNYYGLESVGIAVGMLISALNRFGLATLTHTPAPMGFLNSLCGRPKHEKPFVLLPVGYPDKNATVPDLPRKPESEMIFRLI
jgi:iodotyrosine deiodinase